MEEKEVEKSYEMGYLNELYTLPPWEYELLEVRIARMSHAY